MRHLNEPTLKVRLGRRTGKKFVDFAPKFLIKTGGWLSCQGLRL